MLTNKKNTVHLAEVNNRAVLAEQVIDNPVFQQAFAALRAKTFDNFTKTKFKQTEDREECWRKMQVMDAFEKELTEAMRTAKIKNANKI